MAKKNNNRKKNARNNKKKVTQTDSSTDLSEQQQQQPVNDQTENASSHIKLAQLNDEGFVVSTITVEEEESHLSHLAEQTLYQIELAKCIQPPLAQGTSKDTIITVADFDNEPVKKKEIETSKLAEETKPTEDVECNQDTKPIEEPVTSVEEAITPIEEVKPVEEIKFLEEIKPVEEIKLFEEIKPTDEVKHTEEIKPVAPVTEVKEEVKPVAEINLAKEETKPAEEIKVVVKEEIKPAVTVKENPTSPDKEESETDQKDETSVPVPTPKEVYSKSNETEETPTVQSDASSTTTEQSTIGEEAVEVTKQEVVKDSKKSQKNRNMGGDQTTKEKGITKRKSQILGLFKRGSGKEKKTNGVSQVSELSFIAEKKKSSEKKLKNRKSWMFWKSSSPAATPVQQQ